MNTKNLHLIVSIIIIIPIGITYGMIPIGFLKTLFPFEFDDIALTGIFRSIMGLYLAISVFWIIGVVRVKLWRAATLLNVLFMSGLAFGRFVSILFDGLPSSVFIAGLLLEVVLAAWGILNLRKYSN